MIFPLTDTLFSLFSPKNEFSPELFPITWELIPIISDSRTDYLGLRRNYPWDNLNQLGLYLCYQADLLHKTTYQSNIASSYCYLNRQLGNFLQRNIIFSKTNKQI